MATFVRIAAVVATVLVATSSGVASAVEPISNQASEASFIFVAEEGSFPVDGSGAWFSPDSEIVVRESEGILRIDADDPVGFDYLRVELNAPGLVPLEAGYYPEARNRDTAPNNPGMRVISGSLGCVDEFGEFFIGRIERDATGRLTALDASITHRCHGSDRPALRGLVHFEA